MRIMYSEKQLQKLALVGLINSDVKTKTLEQSEANWEYDASSMFPATTSDGLDVVVRYGAIKQVNKELHCIFLVELQNNTESSITFNGLFTQNSIALPDNIASKVYDFDGKSLAENPSSADTNIGIRADFAGFSKNKDISATATGVICAYRYNKKFLIKMIPLTSASLTAGQKYYAYGEISLLLL